MIKKNKLKIAISSVIILLPVLYGIIMWHDLPDIMSTHWNASGNADGSSSKAFAVFGLPAILLALHFICLLATVLDKKQNEQSPKALNMIFWIIPAVSLFSNGIVYRAALGRSFDSEWIMPVLIGAMFIFMGNYLPKIKQNSTLGIKVKWALISEENWNKTHRFGGKVMVAGGFFILISAFLPLSAMIWVLLLTIIAVSFMPMLYSYLIYRQDSKAGIIYVIPPKSKIDKITEKAVLIAVIAILIGIAVMMFTGNIEVNCEDSTIKINATYWSDLEIAYSEIDFAEYRNDFDVGIKTNGFNSAKLLLGIFQNDEFGAYTLYAYAGAEEFIVLTSEGKSLVIGMKNAEKTQAIYNRISAEIGK